LRTRRQGWCPGTRRNQRWNDPCRGSRNQLKIQRGPKKAIVEGATEVAKNPFGNSEVGFLRGVHVKAHVLDRIGDVGPVEDKVL
jgi:hypothetical protein